MQVQINSNRNHDQNTNQGRYILNLGQKFTNIKNGRIYGIHDKLNIYKIILYIQFKLYNYKQVCNEKVYNRKVLANVLK